MLLLSIDSSTRGCSVALYQDQVLLATNDLFTDRSSSAMLTILLDNLVRSTGHSLHDLDAVAVAKGPGSYTGLRVAVSTAKGLCFALEKPLLAANTLAGMAQQVYGFFSDDTWFCPMIDARRMEVYAAIYNAQGQEMEPTKAIILDETSFAETLDSHRLVFFGDGAAKCKPLLGAHPQAIFLDEEIRPSASTIGKLALAAYEAGDFEDLATFEPYYLKDFMSPKPKKSPLIP
ncbi:tRNA threonylcarbamoyladenosine biosynthesis protein TsaB [Dyadobacter jejuensis]|uniref:tRNA threonylcarbamoyladenosine biosynthesis protein TsaB n=1 Tax=Dyadobacter jejuensis TaxID=1082580 RepID=A0A316ABW3_9BACT|nr:tRNA (adenosine(37)-N6)-threonylcarbamoyltransferase complex dimerization subunit type 1 TsaB [Dyadobacter jejuensis]PWJ55266.1 tRNA threonylcarbamoyladenosine biosynthesis protein TsaB [Dyadobacter jejuensis]